MDRPWALARTNPILRLFGQPSWSGPAEVRCVWRTITHWPIALGKLWLSGITLLLGMRFSQKRLLTPSAFPQRHMTIPIVPIGQSEAPSGAFRLLLFSNRFDTRPLLLRICPLGYFRKLSRTRDSTMLTCLLLLKVKSELNRSDQMGAECIKSPSATQKYTRRRLRTKHSEMFAVNNFCVLY